MKTIKLYVLAAALILSCIDVYADPLHIRPELGVNFAKMRVDINNFFDTKEFNTSFKPGIRAGINFKVHLVRELFIEPGFFYSQKGFIRKDQLVGTWVIPVIVSKRKMTYSTHYLELPVNFGYDMALKKGGNVFITVGPYLGYAMGGKIKVEFEDDRFPDASRAIQIGSDKSDELKAIDFGLNAGLGYQAPQGIYFRAQGGLGAANLVTNENEGNMKNITLAFLVGYDLPTGSHKKRK